MTSEKSKSTIIFKDGTELERYYIARNSRYQLGWSLMSRTDDDGNIVRPHLEIFYHTSEDVVKLALQDIIVGKFNKNKYPALSSLSPMILVFKEKHCDIHYIYTSRDELFKIFLNVLIERNNNGWYKHIVPEKPENKTKLTLEEINSIEDIELRNFQLKRYQNFEKELRSWEKSLILKDQIQRAIDQRDGRLAFHIHETRKMFAHEYEDFEIIKPTTIE